MFPFNLTLNAEHTGSIMSNEINIATEAIYDIVVTDIVDCNSDAFGIYFSTTIRGVPCKLYAHDYQNRKGGRYYRNWLGLGKLQKFPLQPLEEYVAAMKASLPPQMHNVINKEYEALELKELLESDNTQQKLDFIIRELIDRVGY